jgi:hypothetical protein
MKDRAIADAMRENRKQSSISLRAGFEHEKHTLLEARILPSPQIVDSLQVSCTQATIPIVTTLRSNAARRVLLRRSPVSPTLRDLIRIGHFLETRRLEEQMDGVRTYRRILARGEDHEGPSSSLQNPIHSVYCAHSPPSLEPKSPTDPSFANNFSPTMMKSPDFAERVPEAWLRAQECGWFKRDSSSRWWTRWKGSRSIGRRRLSEASPRDGTCTML